MTIFDNGTTEADEIRHRRPLAIGASHGRVNGT
jgi:hypothetical protein